MAFTINHISKLLFFDHTNSLLPAIAKRLWQTSLWRPLLLSFILIGATTTWGAAADEQARREIRQAAPDKRAAMEQQENHHLRFAYELQEDRDAFNAMMHNDTTRLSKYFKAANEEMAIRTNYDIFPVDHLRQEIQDVKNEFLNGACKYNKINIVHFLLHAGANINHQLINRGNYTGLMQAALAGHVNIVKILLEADADVTLQDIDENNTALHIAAQQNRLDVVILLLQKIGANHLLINLQNNMEYSALICAAASGHVNVVKILLKAGADITLQDIDGNSALHKAAKQNHFDIVNLLLLQIGENRAFLNLQDNLGNSALHHAAAAGNSAITEKLLQAGADIEAQTEFGSTPLILATMLNKQEVVKILLQYGASKEAVDIHGINALDLAKKHEYLAIIKLLEQ